MKMLDLHAQYLSLKEEINGAIESVIEKTDFIQGEEVVLFAQELADFVGCRHVTPCANGTDALQIALMVLGLERGEEVLVPAFTYIASAEVIALLGLKPVLVDVDEKSFCLAPEQLEKALSPRTRAIIPVHLFGSICPMEPILRFAQKHHLYVIEDNAQALGAIYTHSDGSRQQAGTLGHIGCTSFFPSKNLGCYGDGGAIFTDDEMLAERLKMIANHGQRTKYRHEEIGCNSRLDTLQAAILRCKLPHLTKYNTLRREIAQRYTEALQGLNGILTPSEMPYSSHVYHQYTLRVLEGKRDALRRYLAEEGIPSMVYYPHPLHHQPAFAHLAHCPLPLTTAERLCQEVLSLPIYPEFPQAEQERVITSIQQFAQTPNP